MSVQEWDIHAPTDWVYAGPEIAVIVSAVQQFQAVMSAGLMAKDPRGIAVTLHGIGVAAIEAAVVHLDPCEVCGFEDWPEGGMHAARNIHMRDHEVTAETMARRASSRGERAPRDDERPKMSTQ